MKRIVGILLLAVIMITGQMIPQQAEAATYQIVAEGQYVMGDGDTREIAKDKAVKDAMRIAVEKAGVYVESYSKTQNLQLTDDQVRMVAAGCIKVLDQSVDFYTENNDWRAQAVIYAEVNTNNINLKEIMQRYSSGSNENVQQKNNDDSMYSSDEEPYTCITFDCSELPESLSLLKFNTQSCIKSESGQIIYSIRTIPYAQAKRVMNHEIELAATVKEGSKKLWMKHPDTPLVIYPIFLEETGAPGIYRNIIISDEDAKKVKAADEKYRLLKRCYVNVITKEFG